VAPLHWFLMGVVGWLVRLPAPHFSGMPLLKLGDFGVAKIIGPGGQTGFVQGCDRRFGAWIG
jgi:hypothetical protein